MIDRREQFVGGAAAAMLLSTEASARKPAPLPAVPKPGSHEPVPLPFDASKLRGLSAAMLTSHHDNNYVGAVKNLNKVEAAIEAATKGTPGFELYGLRERQLA